MFKSKLLPALAIVFALAATTVSYKLFLKHMTGSSGSSWFDAGCSDEETAGAANCAAVLASPYSYFPPRLPDEPAGTPHLPVAFLGLIYYSLLSVWLIGIGRPAYTYRFLHLLPMLFVCSGLASSGYYIWIMFSELDQWCPWCMVTHALNALIAVSLVLMWPRNPKPMPAGESTQPEDAVSTTVPAHPTARLVVLTGVAMFLVLFGNQQLLGRTGFERRANANQRNYDLCMTAVNRIKGDADTLVASWQRAPGHRIPIRTDDPARMTGTDTTHPLDLIVFSDFECPVCNRVARFLEHSVDPLFGGNLHMVFKHYPLHADCNPQTKTKMHPRACEAAKQAEAVRLVGGNDAFWKAHDYLFANQKRFKQHPLTLDDMAASIGISAAQISDAMMSSGIEERIAEDARLAHTLGVTTTPSVFLSGRRVDAIARGSVVFWDRIADIYWKNRKLPRPESTKLPKKTITPGSPGPKAAP